MTAQKTKSLQAIDDRLETIPQGSLRHSVLKAARTFKMSWIELGQLLHQVWRSKSFKEWGYLTFDGYVTQEIGIRHQTASKLLKSYLFLEREDPAYIRRDSISEEARELEGGENPPGVRIPSFEAIDALRRAKGKISETEYQDLKRDAFDGVKEGKELRKQLQGLMREQASPDPEKVRVQRRTLALGRLVRTIKTVSQEAEMGKFLPKQILRELAELTKKIEAELERP